MKRNEAVMLFEELKYIFSVANTHHIKICSGSKVFLGPLLVEGDWHGEERAEIDYNSWGLDDLESS
jgi:hypothetical protein